MNATPIIKLLGRAILIWIATNAFGTLLVTVLHPILTIDEILMGISLTLVFSSPTVVVLIPITSGLQKFRTLQGQVIYSVGSIFFLCVLVITFFFSVIGFRILDVYELAPLIAPYFVMAQLSFLTINSYTLK